MFCKVKKKLPLHLHRARSVSVDQIRRISDGSADGGKGLQCWDHTFYTEHSIMFGNLEERMHPVVQLGKF